MRSIKGPQDSWYSRKGCLMQTADLKLDVAAHMNVTSMRRTVKGELYLEDLRPEMRPSVSEVPLVLWLPVGLPLGMPAMILPPLPCSSSFGLHSHSPSGMSRAGAHVRAQCQSP